MNEHIPFVCTYESLRAAEGAKIPNVKSCICSSREFSYQLLSFVPWMREGTKMPPQCLIPIHPRQPEYIHIGYMAAMANLLF